MLRLLSSRPWSLGSQRGRLSRKRESGLRIYLQIIMLETTDYLAMGAQLTLKVDLLLLSLQRLW